MNNDDILTKENWHAAVLETIEDLPEDIQASVGHSDPSADSVIIKVACEPTAGEDSETELNDVTIRWWNTRREELTSYIIEKEKLQQGSDEEKKRLEFEEQYQKEVIDRPNISVEAGGSIEGVVLARPRWGNSRG